MSDLVKQWQLAALSVLAAIATVGSVAYIAWQQPPSLKVSRNGVPFFTPPVAHPDTGEAITVDELVQHYKKSMQ